MFIPPSAEADGNIKVDRAGKHTILTFCPVQKTKLPSQSYIWDATGLLEQSRHTVPCSPDAAQQHYKRHHGHEVQRRRLVVVYTSSQIRGRCMANCHATGRVETAYVHVVIPRGRVQRSSCEVSRTMMCRSTQRQPNIPVSRHLWTIVHSFHRHDCKQNTHGRPILSNQHIGPTTWFNHSRFSAIGTALGG